MNPEEIWIIGTDPPCPRCDYLTRMVQDIVAGLQLPATVRHLAYTDEEVRLFAASLGLEPGTAKDVARKADVAVDWGRVHALVEGPAGATGPGGDAPCCPTAAANWSPALDEALRSCERIARQVGILMTPALVVGGHLLHQGSVPDRREATAWIRDRFGPQTGGSPEAHIVEILGAGCDKCDMLHENVCQAVAQHGLSDRVSVLKRTDIAYFHQMGVFVTPGLVIDGTVVSKGQVLTADQVADRLNDLLPHSDGTAAAGCAPDMIHEIGGASANPPQRSLERRQAADGYPYSRPRK